VTGGSKDQKNALFTRAIRKNIFSRAAYRALYQIYDFIRTFRLEKYFFPRILVPEVLILNKVTGDVPVLVLRDKIIGRYDPVTDKWITRIIYRHFINYDRVNRKIESFRTDEKDILISNNPETIE